MHHQPNLGIKDPYELTEDQYKAALDLLRQQRAIVNRYWHDAFVQIDDFTNEGVVASSSWPFQVNILRAKDQPIASVVPVEGATGWADTTMMHAEAPHPNCAYKWMEWTLSSNLQGDLAAWFGSVPVVLDACDQERAARPGGLQDQRPRELRAHPLLAHAGRQVRHAERVRALLSLGHGLHRGARGALKREACGRPEWGSRPAA